MPYFSSNDKKNKGELLMNKQLSKKKVIGKQVIDKNGMIIGNVNDISFDLDSKEIEIIVISKKGTTINFSSEEIESAGDVLLLNKEVDLQTLPTPSPPPETPSPSPATPTTTPPETSTKPGLCQLCKFQNDPGSKFCIKCGQKLSQ
jgi:sporulation protein YlmC with PRC-barrel domain